MNKEPILLVMAAGMGSRYGGLKQMDPIGPDGEVILDYSIFDAKRAGFRRVIFLIKHEIEADFKQLIGRRIEPHMEVRYAFQSTDRIPEPFAVPEGRVKPWGTGHAVLCCKDLIDAPFAVINADDYYGVSAFQSAYRFLKAAEDPKACLMVGYLLKNTLSETGYVARGVCTLDEMDRLVDINERTHIIASCDGPLYTEDGETYHLLKADTPVSMNMWAFHPSILAELEDRFPEFLVTAIEKNPLKAEFFLPTVVDHMLKRGEISVKVEKSADKWYGVTYREDKPLAASALKQMHDSGLYPSPMWAQEG